jgi:hypothetical protein
MSQFSVIWKGLVDKLSMSFKRFRELYNSVPEFKGKEVPIVINNRDTLHHLSELVEKLKQFGYHKIIVLDNQSTYPPLLEYYQNASIRVVYLNQNIGPYALWQSDLFEEIRHDYYVYTDSDILPIENCPPDFINHFKDILDRYTSLEKVGFSLKIDDLPSFFPFKEDVLAHEIKFQECSQDEQVYFAPIDTTFALYRPDAFGGWRIPAARTKYPYTARHAPWYIDPNQLPDDMKYYLVHTERITHWTEKLQSQIK